MTQLRKEQVALGGDLTALEALTGTGFAKRTGVDTWSLTNATLQYFTEAESAALTAKRTNSLSVLSADTNVNIGIIPKGTGSIVAAIPDGTATGGSQRGNNAIDLQFTRSAASQVASGAGSVLIGGSGYNTASNGGSCIVGSSNSSNTAPFSIVLAGSYCALSGGYNFVMGFGAVGDVSYSGAFGYGGHTLAREGSWALGGGGYETNAGDSQQVFVKHRNRTTDATQTALTSDSSTSRSASNIYTLQNYQSVTAQILVNAIRKGSEASDHGAWIINIRAYRGANAASTTVSIIQALNDGTAGATSWAATVLADTTIGGFYVAVTGVAATNIQWSAAITAVENIYA